MFELQEGLNECTNEEYHGDKRFYSSSSLKLLLKDPEAFHEEYILRKPKERKEIPAFAEGSYAHSLILEPETIEKEYAFYEGMRKAGKEWEAFKTRDDVQGKTIISKSQKGRVKLWVEAYEKRRGDIDIITSDGFVEHTLVGSIRGVPLKVRADYINVDKGYIADVKTTSFPTDVESFKYTIGQFEYDLSAALYTEMFSEHYGKPFDFYFVVLGKKDLMCHVYKMSNMTMAKGKHKVHSAITKYLQCVETGDWTGNKSGTIIETGGDYEVLEV